jgi:hypothetical protein
MLLVSRIIVIADLVRAQVLCFYFIFTVSATVGFGDIVAMNTTERVRRI